MDITAGSYIYNGKPTKRLVHEFHFANCLIHQQLTGTYNIDVTQVLLATVIMIRLGKDNELQLNPWSIHVDFSS